LYVGLVAATLWYIHRQLKGQREQIDEQVKNSRFQELLTVFKELKDSDLMEARRYIYEKFPETIEGAETKELKRHLLEAEMAFITFDRIGYSIEKGHIDGGPIIENFWVLIWRCWKKSESLINWAREQRGQKDSLKRFQYLFDLAEAHRLQKGYPEPKFF